MFRTWLGLVGVSAFLAFTPAANAQRGGGGHSSGGHSSGGHSSAGHSSAGHSSGHSAAYHGGSIQHHSANYGHYNNNRFYGYGLGLGFGLGYPYGSYGSYGSYGGPGYYGSSDYDYYDAPNYDRAPSYEYARPVAPEPTPAEDGSAHVEVIVADADARVWFDDAATTSRGRTRYFDTPPLEPNSTFSYKIKASWNQDGEKVNAERVVRVRAGSHVVVDFSRPAPAQ